MTEASTPPVYFLLVDDREENLVALEAILRRENLTLLKARSGPEALETLLKHEVALALVDVQMPSMDGFELAELMRGTQRTRRIPIIFLTAGSEDQQRNFRGYEAGAVDFLHKPIEPSILKSKADVFFDLYCQRQEVARQRDELQAINQQNALLLKQSQQLTEVLQNADRRKNEFLATLAHELRNPLAPILHAVQIVQMGGMSPDELVDIYDIVERQVHHMARLIDDLLDVSRITRGKIKLRTENVSIADVVKSAVETNASLISDAGHQLDVNLPSEKLVVRGDAVRLSQVLGNLLNNAAKYTPHGGHIWLDVNRRNDDVRLRVKDNGMGIPLKAQGEIFEMFHQVNQHFQQARGGLGIGLTLVKRLVEMHGGSVDLASQGEGMGTEFTVQLPLTSASDDEVAPLDVQPSESSPRYRVLIIDDNVDAAQSMAMLLRLEGHEVTIAFDGESGIEQAEAGEPDVIFLDLGMPEIDGFDTLKRIRELPEGGRITVVAVTGWGQSEDRRRTQEAGFHLHLVKPVDIKALKSLFAQISSQVQPWAPPRK